MNQLFQYNFFLILKLTKIKVENPSQYLFLSACLNMFKFQRSVSSDTQDCKILELPLSAALISFTAPAQIINFWVSSSEKTQMKVVSIKRQNTFLKWSRLSTKLRQREGWPHSPYPPNITCYPSPYTIHSSLPYQPGWHHRFGHTRSPRHTDVHPR